MSHHDTRKGMSQAVLNEQLSQVLICEIFVLSVVAGVYTKSWWIGGGLLFALCAGLTNGIASKAIVIVLTLGWGAIGARVGSSLFESVGAAVVLGVLGLGMGWGIHTAGLQWVRDIQD